MITMGSTALPQNTTTATTDQSNDLHDLAYKSPNSIDELLSKELLQLSMKDRNVIEEEIHGVSSLAPRESPDFLAASLQELSEELSKIPEESKVSYVESQILPSTYVNTSDFRLRFLRCDLFDAKKAAIRLVKFLDFAVELFGPVVLERPVRISDLSKDEQKQMNNFQILPYRDQSGRPIWAWVGDHGMKEASFFTSWRICLYYQYCASEDIETQQKGFTLLIWVGSNKLTAPVEWGSFEYSRKMQEASPLRPGSAHWCMPEVPLYHPIHIARCILALAWGKDKSRMKFHIGEKVELLYKLKTYGIPIEYIPVTETGNIKTAYLKQWIQGRHHLEDLRENGSPYAHSIILCPRSKDVIFRSGTPLKCHPGIVMFDSIIEGKAQEHMAASQIEKVAITKAIIEEVQQQGGRFLKWVKSGWWAEMEESSIHAKVAQKMRRLASKINARQQISRSSTVAFQNQDNGKRRKLSSHEKDSDGSDSGAKDHCSCFF